MTFVGFYISRGETEKMKIGKILGLTVLATLGLLVGGSQTTEASVYTFSVVPELPENQLAKKAGYFDLMVNPGATQDLKLKYTNNTDHAVTVNADVTTATTNGGGEVDYEGDQKKLDPTLTAKTQDMITVPQDVTLAARETKEVTAHVTVPQAGLTGISSGAFTFRDKDSQQHAQAASAGMAVKNVYAFQIAVLMRQQKDTPFTFNQIQRSGLQLHRVAAGQVNARNVIKANLQNPLAKYINDFTTVAIIKKADSDKTVLSQTNTDQQMAPNSNFDLAIAYANGAAMKPGKYVLDLTAYGQKDDQGGYQFTDAAKTTKFAHRWHFEKTFTITGSEATQYNKADFTVTKDAFNWWSLLAVLLAVLITVFWFILWKRRRDDEEESEQN